MSDDPSTVEEQVKTYTAPATQADFDRLVADRLSRQAAKYADYDDLKTKATQLAAIEDANKTDMQKVIDRATKAESDLATMPAKVSEKLRAHLVALGVVAKEDEVLLTASDPEALLAQVKRLGERSESRRKRGLVIPREGQSTNQTKANELSEFTRNLFGQKE